MGGGSESCPWLAASADPDARRRCPEQRDARPLHAAPNRINHIPPLLACQLFLQWIRQALTELCTPQRNKHCSHFSSVFLCYSKCFNTKILKYFLSTSGAFHCAHSLQFFCSVLGKDFSSESQRCPVRALGEHHLQRHRACPTSCLIAILFCSLQSVPPG